jgi:hypothetical protein
MKLVKESLVKEIVDQKPKTAKEVLLLINKKASAEHWKRNGVNRMSVYFSVCLELNIDDTNLN